MRKLIQTLITFGVLANQVATPVIRPATASTGASAAVETANFDIKLNTKTVSALELTDKRPDFDRDVVAPLKAAQVAKLKAEQEKQAAKEQAAIAAAAQAAAEAQARISTAKASPQTTVGVLSAAAINALGMCESGMTANRNSGNGFYGAFQFSAGTWSSMNTGYARADLAPIEVQIDAVQRLLARSSIWGQFPACANRLSAQGLL
jgi:hypothetical protein